MSAAYYFCFSQQIEVNLAIMGIGRHRDKTSCFGTKRSILTSH